MKSIEGNFENTEVNKMLINHFIELRSASPEGSAHVLDIEGLKDSSIKFWSLWENQELMGCGALKFLEKKHGEFKSIRVKDEFRKKGNGLIIIEHLIEQHKNNEQIETPQNNALAISLSKSLAINKNTTLTLEEMLSLKNKLLSCSSPNICPSGKLTMINLPASDLEKYF